MTKLVFLGTRGDIEEHSKKHRYHSSLLLVSKNFRLLVDYGMLHKYSLHQIKPRAVLITHAHPDHYVWLKKMVKTKIPVYLTRHTLEYGKFKPENCQVIKSHKNISIGPFTVLPYRVLHSIKCPAIGFKIKTPEQKTIVYNPDLVDIVQKNKILKNVDYYIGDGSCIKANLVRRKNNKFFGHARITTQINWCKQYDIEHMIFTHLGKETLSKEKDFAQNYPDVVLAYDGMELQV